MGEASPAGLVNESEHRVSSFGDRLRREREGRGISLDDVSLSTKISLRMLRALEEERFEQLPGGIFNKGFVRAYARHLRIDEEQAVADYLEAVGETTPPPLPEPIIEDLSPPKPARMASLPQLPWGILAIFFLVAALGLSLWSYRTREANTNPVQAPATASAQPQLQPVVAEPTNPAPFTPGHDSSRSGVSAEGQVAAPEYVAPAAAQNQLAPALPVASTVKNSGLISQVSPAAVNPARQAPAPAPFVVLIEAEENSWVSITADGKTILDGTLIAPAVKAVRAQKEIVVKAGNAGGLSFSFNGKKLTPQGDPGTAKTLVFSPSGLEGSGPKPPA